jgi:hypothetical protein
MASSQRPARRMGQASPEPGRDPQPHSATLYHHAYTKCSGCHQAWYQSLTLAWRAVLQRGPGSRPQPEASWPRPSAGRIYRLQRAISTAALVPALAVFSGTRVAVGLPCWRLIRLTWFRDKPQRGEGSRTARAADPLARRWRVSRHGNKAETKCRNWCSVAPPDATSPRLAGSWAGRARARRPRTAVPPLSRRGRGDTTWRARATADGGTAWRGTAAQHKLTSRGMSVTLRRIKMIMP